MLWIGMIAFLGLGFLAYVRLAPSAVERWHVPPNGQQDRAFGNGVLRRVTIGRAGLYRLDQIAEADPRTERLAGNVDQGMVTYITRSRMVGFPDYTTVMQAGEDLLIFARSRFGRRDFGVNGARVSRWLDALAVY